MKLNGASGMSDIEGKATRVGASERGQRTSFNYFPDTIRFNSPLDESAVADDSTL